MLDNVKVGNLGRELHKSGLLLPFSMFRQKQAFQLARGNVAIAVPKEARAMRAGPRPKRVKGANADN